MATTDDRVASDDMGRESDATGQAAPDALTAAMTAADDTSGLGRPGRPMNRRSPFFVGMAAAAGVAVTYGLAETVIKARSVLVIVGLAFFVAAGLDPAVSWLGRRRVPRWAGVLIVVLTMAGVIAAFVLAAIPPLTSQATELANHLPQYLHALRNPHSELGRLNLRYHIQDRLTALVASRGSDIARGVLGAGEVVLGAVASLVVVVVLTVYFLAGMPRRPFSCCYERSPSGGWTRCSRHPRDACCQPPAYEGTDSSLAAPFWPVYSSGPREALQQ